MGLDKQALWRVIRFWVVGIVLVGSIAGYVALISIIPTWLGVTITISGAVIFLSVVMYQDEKRTSIRKSRSGSILR